MTLTVIADKPDAIRVARGGPPDAHTAAAIEVRYIVFFLNDAVPSDLVERMERAPATATLAEALAALCRFDGSCALGYPWNAKSVEDALRTGHGRQYRLLAWRVLPNHVHVLLEPAPGWPAGDPIHRWKQASSPRRKGAARPGLERFGPDRLRPRALRAERPRPDEFWADEDFERILRTRREVEQAVQLIEGISLPAQHPALSVPIDPLESADEAPSAPPEVEAPIAVDAASHARDSISRSALRLRRWFAVARDVAGFTAFWFTSELVAWLTSLVIHALRHTGIGR